MQQQRRFPRRCAGGGFARCKRLAKRVSLGVGLRKRIGLAERGRRALSAARTDRLAAIERVVLGQ